MFGLKLYTYITSLHTQFAAVALPVEGQFLPAMWNSKVQFLILWHRILRPILSIKEGQNSDHAKAWIKNGCQFGVSWIIQYATLEDKVHKYSNREYDNKQQLKHRATDFCWMCSTQSALVVIMVLQTDDAYSYLELRCKVTRNNQL